MLGVSVAGLLVERVLTPAPALAAVGVGRVVGHVVAVHVGGFAVAVLVLEPVYGVGKVRAYVKGVFEI